MEGDGSSSAEPKTDAGGIGQPRLGCDWEGEYGELLSVHLGRCQHQAVECPRGCGESLLRGELDAHGAECTENKELCRICGEYVKPGTMEDHRKEKSEEHLRLLELKFFGNGAEGENAQGSLAVAPLDLDLTPSEVVWRTGKGWINPPVWSLLGFAKEVGIPRASLWSHRHVGDRPDRREKAG